jgi:hypothetical protein
MYNNLSAALSAADVQAVKTAITTIRNKLPFLISLTKEERRKLFKMGDKSLAFVQNSLLAAKNNSDILPARFDVDEFERRGSLRRAERDQHRTAKALLRGR